MPYQAMPQFKAVQDSMIEIPQPGVGGLNLKDLEYEQEVNQSPYMLNMMYQNGAFGKRFGQEINSEYEDDIYAMISYGGDIYVHSGTKIYKGDTEIASGMPTEKGLFIVYAQTLYYLNSSGFYQYKDDVWGEVEPYIPDVVINCRPNGEGGGDSVDDYNIIGRKFNFIYNSDGTSTVYKVENYDKSGFIDWDVTPTITVDDVETTAFTVDKTNKTITFTTAPPAQELGVVMTFTLKSDLLVDERGQILACKYYDTFGGSNNSRLFLAGCGNSKYFYSDSYDISYFPEQNFGTLGNTEEDITGFGRQYNILIVFKPKEVYSVYSYVETAQTTILEEQIGMENFKSQLVNAKIGCDAPHSIQLINNLLTWFNSNEGICTLVSTNIVDERNVRTISRNVDRTNTFNIPGLLDIEEDPDNIQSADFDNKYFIAFPTSGYCYMWDYEISPYSYSASGRETPPKSLTWFLFDHIYAKQFLKIGKELLFASSHTDFEGKIIKLNNTFNDLDFDNDGQGDAIESFYMTPFLQFNAVEYLKNVRNLYIQCRGDTASYFDIYYYVDESGQPEKDSESISVGKTLWDFTWENFSWGFTPWAITYRRKCSLKKIQMASFYFYSNEVARDLSISHLGMQYQIVKNIK